MIDLPFLPYWMNETSGKLREAVFALTRTWNGDCNQLSPKHLKILKKYFALWINYPGWKRSGHEQEFDRLSLQLKSIATIEQLNQWLENARDIGIDPL